MPCPAPVITADLPTKSLSALLEPFGSAMLTPPPSP
jgi:hypothetical protein